MNVQVMARFALFIMKKGKQLTLHRAGQLYDCRNECFCIAITHEQLTRLQESQEARKGTEFPPTQSDDPEGCALGMAQFTIKHICFSPVVPRRGCLDEETICSDKFILRKLLKDSGNNLLAYRFIFLAMISWSEHESCLNT